MSEWSVAANSAIDAWNDRLLDSQAGYRQYPCWNEPYRDEGKEIHYLTWGGGSSELFASVVGDRLGPWRVGLVQRGPVPLGTDSTFSLEAQRALWRWARERGYVCLRFTHSDPDLLLALHGKRVLRDKECWPFHRDPPRSLFVDRLATDHDTLMSFQPVARKDIKRAETVGYQIEWSDSVEAMSTAWTMFEALAQRKGFVLTDRPKSSWMGLCEVAQRHRLGRLYSATINGRCVEAVYVLRYGNVAEYMLGAIDLDAIADPRGPSCLLHWRAMRDFFNMGCTRYNLGGPGDMRTNFVWQFKRKFRPTLVTAPRPVTVVIRPVAYASYSAAVLKAFIGGRSLSRRAGRRVRLLLARH